MKKKDKINNEEEEDLTLQDIEDEIDHHQFSMFWGQLDLEKNWKNIMKLFIVRFMIIVSQVHLKKHPDEIQQGKEIAYKIMMGQSS